MGISTSLLPPNNLDLALDRSSSGVRSAKRFDNFDDEMGRGRFPSLQYSIFEPIHFTPAVDACNRVYAVLD